MRKTLLLICLLMILQLLGFAAKAQTFGEEPQPSTEVKPATPNNIYYNPIVDRKPIVGAQNPQTANRFKKKIYIYYRDFNVSSTPSGRVMCHLRLSLLTNIPEGINTLDVRFKWPKMQTGMSFYDVKSNQETYHDITLLGDGCYSLDKTPNLVVNTCRIKGMSASECAAAVIWVKPIN